MISLWNVTKRILWSVVPSYIQNLFDDSPKSAPRTYPTSALDGLRGVAALFVFFFHILFSYTNFIEYGYGQSPNQKQWFQFPFIRLIYSGHAMVVIFFVVGGYVFSLKPLKLIRSHQHSGFLATLVSSVFRRAIRLYAPAIIATLLSMLTIQMGLWEYPRRYIKEDRSIIYYADNHIERLAFGPQLADWIHQTKLLTNVFTYYNTGFSFPYYPRYDPHLWTIPVELRSSLILALCLLGFSQCRVVARLTLNFATIVFCIVWDRWELVCFLGGSMLCEIDMVTNAFFLPSKDFKEEEEEEDSDVETLPQYERMSFATAPRRCLSFTAHTLEHSKVAFIIYLLISLYFLSAPNLDIQSTPGYSWIGFITPPSYSDKKRWPHTLGTLMLIATLNRAPFLRKPFEMGFTQYLGKISFSLYIVHGPLIHMVGYSVIPWIWVKVMGMKEEGVAGMEPWRWWIGLLMGSTILASVVALVADWFWRVIEGSSIEWAKKFEKWCFTPAPQQDNLPLIEVNQT